VSEKDLHHLVHHKIDIAALLEQASTPAAGAVLLFAGTPRNHSDGRTVLHLEYDAYEPIAESRIEAILTEAIERWGLHAALCVHRLGRVPVSESAIVVVTAASHRKEGFESNRYIVDAVKKTVPIWKHEFFADGSSRWGDSA